MNASLKAVEPDAIRFEATFSGTLAEWRELYQIIRDFRSGNAETPNIGLDILEAVASTLEQAERTFYPKPPPPKETPNAAEADQR